MRENSLSLSSSIVTVTSIPPTTKSAVMGSRRREKVSFGSLWSSPRTMKSMQWIESRSALLGTIKEALTGTKSTPPIIGLKKKTELKMKLQPLVWLLP